MSATAPRDRADTRPPRLVSPGEVGKRVRRERERLGLNQRSLAQRASMPLSRVHRIETEPNRSLDFDDLGRLAAALGVTLGRLTSRTPTQTRVLAAMRATGDEGDIADAVEQICDIVDLEEGLHGLADPAHQRPPLDDVLSAVKAEHRADPTRCGAEMARALRAHMGLGGAPLGDLTALVENATGALVAFLPLPASVSGVCVTARDTGVAVIAVNTQNTNAARQRFTLAHELGHLLAGDTHIDTKPTRSRPERLANAFAAEFLMPVHAVRDWVARAVEGEEKPPEDSDETIAMLMAAYGVNAATAAIQLGDAGLLSRRRVAEVKDLTGRRAATLIDRGAEWEAEDAIAATPRAPRRLWQRALSAYQEGIITLAPLARISGRPEVSLEEELARAEVQPGWRESSASPVERHAAPSPFLDLDALLDTTEAAGGSR